MEKRILLAVDDSIHSMHAVKYAVSLSSIVKESTYTLFHVQPIISLFLQDEAKRDFKAKTELDKLIRENTEHARSMLEKYKAEMIRQGIPDERIDVATQPRLLGLVKDILERAHKGGYDAIVVGRRGVSLVQKTFVGSVTAKLLEHSRVVPLWVIDGDVTSTKFMIAVDGSEASLRAVDYLGSTFRENPEIEVTLFHVVPRLGDYLPIDFDEKEAHVQQVIAQGDKRRIDHFYAQSLKKFGEAGIQEKQIKVKVTKRTLNVGKAIVDEAEQGDYGTVVVGRRGASKAFFMGSVSRYVVDNTSNRALWLVS